MDIQKCTMQSFSVIGKEGSTNDGDNFIQSLWADANAHFNEVADLALKDEKGNILGIWGLMSDFSRSFKPWESNFTQGIYLAGVQVDNEVIPPDNWIKWTAPASEYLYVRVEKDYRQTFKETLNYIQNNNYELAGAVYDYNCPEENGQPYLFFPIGRL